MMSGQKRIERFDSQRLLRFYGLLQLVEFRAVAARRNRSDRKLQIIGSRLLHRPGQARDGGTQRFAFRTHRCRPTAYSEFHSFSFIPRA